MILDRVYALRRGGNVRRYHTEALIGEQTVAAHSFHMAIMALHFWPDCSANLLKAILYHDLPEYFVGDMPAPAKRSNPALWEALHAAEAKVEQDLGLEVALTPEEREQFLLMDALEACFFAYDQIKLGNATGKTVMQNGWKYVQTHNPPPFIRLILEALVKDAGVEITRV